jgi:hypothetical protein
MVIPYPILRAFNPSSLYDQIQKYKVTDDTLIPWDYQTANPAGRPLHDDWSLFQATPRIMTAYRVPLPFKQILGDCVPQWQLWDTSYPASPGLIIENRPVTVDGGATYNLPHALVDCAVEDGGSATFAVWLDGKWVPCFTSYRKMILGKRLASYTGGLKQDYTVTPNLDGSVKSDIMGWWDPPTCSWNAVAA